MFLKFPGNKKAPLAYGLGGCFFMLWYRICGSYKIVICGFNSVIFIIMG